VIYDEGEVIKRGTYTLKGCTKMALASL
jgi:hypothetical protein